MKGQLLLDEVNTIRAVQGLAPVVSIRLAGTDSLDPALCPIAVATTATVARGIAPRWASKLTLRLSRGSFARMAGTALDLPFEEATREVLAPSAVVSFVIAASYGLVFADDGGLLRGWIEPTDDDPSRWDLHLLPGHEYPKGHGPETVRDATSSA